MNTKKWKRSAANLAEPKLRAKGVDSNWIFAEIHNPMPLISCPECGKQVSTVAKACPLCGFPVAEKLASESVTPATNELLAEVRPSWWNFFWHFLFCWLLVPPIIAAFRRTSVVLRIYSGRVTLERGLFSKCYRDFIPRDIRSIDIDQSLLARIVGIGDITISTAATVEAVEKIEGIPEPQRVRELILAQRRDSSLR
jgi:membrane protein YdbS with pleckstrin-like domain